jgi:hypothetical protein
MGELCTRPDERMLNRAESMAKEKGFEPEA